MGPISHAGQAAQAQIQVKEKGYKTKKEKKGRRGYKDVGGINIKEGTVEKKKRKNIKD
jgi:hypothetical protein